MSRREVARKLRVSPSRLRAWEAAGVLPDPKLVPTRLYVDRVRLLLAGRRVMSTQRLRECLALPGC